MCYEYKMMHFVSIRLSFKEVVTFKGKQMRKRKAVVYFISEHEGATSETRSYFIAKQMVCRRDKVATITVSATEENSIFALATLP